MVSFFSAKQIDALVKPEDLSLNSWAKVEVFEIALIHAYDPEFQRHQVKRLEKYLKKFGIPETGHDGDFVENKTGLGYLKWIPCASSSNREETTLWVLRSTESMSFKRVSSVDLVARSSAKKAHTNRTQLMSSRSSVSFLSIVQSATC